MSIKADRSSTPSRPVVENEVPPDEDDSLTAWLLRRGLDINRPDDELELAVPEAGPIRASWAGMCARRISYELLEPDKKTPLTLATRYRFALGTFIHELLQSGIDKSMANEVNVDLNVIGVPGSAHADMVDDDSVTELKSINGFGFKQHATRDRGPAKGPRLSAVLQGGMSALALGKPRLRIVYLAMENLSNSAVGRYAYNRASEIAQCGVQWTFDVEELRPAIEREAKRLARIAELAAEGEVAPRQIVDEETPRGATITDPKTGAWQLLDKDRNMVQVGGTWQCGYCDFQEHCMGDPR